MNNGEQVTENNGNIEDRGMDFARAGHVRRVDVMEEMGLIWVNEYVFTG